MKCSSQRTCTIGTNGSGGCQTGWQIMIWSASPATCWTCFAHSRGSCSQGEASRWIGELAKMTRVAICSGNHGDAGHRKAANNLSVPLEPAGQILAPIADRKKPWGAAVEQGQLVIRWLSLLFVITQNLPNFLKKLVQKRLQS